MNHGTLIAFEGIDGCGKSTQVERLAETLRGEGRDIAVTREPTEGNYGQRIRRMAREDEKVVPEEELRWFVEDRREHVRDVIAPALAAGRIVISDRYYLSTVAYQGARGLDPAQILADSEAEFPKPDLIVLLEIDAAAGLERVHTRGATLEHAFEDPTFLHQVAEIFASLPLTTIVRIDATPPPDQVHQEVLNAVRPHLP